MLEINFKKLLKHFKSISTHKLLCICNALVNFRVLSCEKGVNIYSCSVKEVVPQQLFVWYNGIYTLLCLTVE